MVKLSRLAKAGDVSSAVEISPSHRLVEVACPATGGNPTAAVEAIGAIPLTPNFMHIPARAHSKSCTWILDECSVPSKCSVCVKMLVCCPGGMP